MRGFCSFQFTVTTILPPPLAPAVTVLPNAHLWCAHNPQSSSRVRFFLFQKAQTRRHHTQKHGAHICSLTVILMFECVGNVVGSRVVIMAVSPPRARKCVGVLTSVWCFSVFFFFCFKCCCTCFFGGSQTATEVSWRVNCTIWERSNYLYAICVQISRDYPKNINVSSVDVLTCQAKFRVDWWLDHHRMPAIFFPTAVIL